MQKSQNLHPLDGVDAEIGFNVLVEVEHVLGIPGAIAHQLQEKLLHVDRFARRLAHSRRFRRRRCGLSIDDRGGCIRDRAGSQGLLGDHRFHRWRRGRFIPGRSHGLLQAERRSGVAPRNRRLGIRQTFNGGRQGMRSVCRAAQISRHQPFLCLQKLPHGAVIFAHSVVNRRQVPRPYRRKIIRHALLLTTVLKPEAFGLFDVCFATFFLVNVPAFHRCRQRYVACHRQSCLLGCGFAAVSEEAAHALSRGRIPGRRVLEWIEVSRSKLCGRCHSSTRFRLVGTGRVDQPNASWQRLRRRRRLQFVDPDVLDTPTPQEYRKI